MALPTLNLGSLISGATSATETPDSNTIGPDGQSLSSIASGISGTTLVNASGPLLFTTGWYVFIGVLAAVLLSNTVIGPVILGIEAVALLYQVHDPIARCL